MGKNTDAREKFKLADKLFREKNYPEALIVLDELDKEFPDTKNVIYPRAMCLARVDRFDEALDLCRQLKVEFGDSRGESLMAKISALRKAKIEKEKEKSQPVKSTGQAVPPPNVFTLDSNPPPLEERLKGKNAEFSPVFDPHAPGHGVIPGGESIGAGPDAMDLGDGSPAIDMAALDDMFAAKPAATAPAIKAQPPSRNGLYIVIGIGVLALIVLLVFVITARRGHEPLATPAPQSAEAPQPQAAAPQFDGPDITWLTSLEEASAAADEEGKDILLIFYSSSAPSPDIDLMDSSVWKDPTIRYFAKNWVCAKIDADQDPESRELWGITKFPTTILTDYALEEQYYRQEGLVDTHQFYTAMTENGLVPQEEGPIELPELPTIALVLLPIFYVIATFLPVLFTLLILGRMPDDDLVTGLMVMVLIGIVSPFAGMIVMRVTYQLERLEVLLYYGLLTVHLIAFMVAMTLVSGFPFHVFLAGLALKARMG
jgi:hypothetical protein